MIRAANHSSFPKVGESPLDQQLRTAWRKQERNEVDGAEVARVTDEVTTICVAEQSRAFIDIVTDGMVGWQGPYSHLARHLEGLSLGGLFRWFETNFYDHRVQVVREVRHSAPFLVHDYQVAETVALTKTVKPVLPGPVTCARMARDRHYGSLEKLAAAFAGALAAEVAELASAGARCFQLDEPLLCRHPDDVGLVADTAARVFEAAGSGATTILSTYFGDLTAIADRLDDLPGTHLGLEAIEGSPNLDLLERLPDGRGVCLGLFDSRTTRQEDAADVAARLEPYRGTLTSRDLIVGPNAGLELLPRDPAFDKLLHARYLVEKLTQDWA